MTVLQSPEGFNKSSAIAGTSAFFSVDVLKLIDVDAIIRERDDIWSEAVELEAKGESVALPEEHWAAARAERDKRTEVDPWEDILADLSPSNRQFYSVTDDEERVFSNGCSAK